jgi:hypothetical protein
MTIDECGLMLASGGCIPKSFMEGPDRPWWQLALVGVAPIALAVVLKYFELRQQDKHPERERREPENLL